MIGRRELLLAGGLAVGAAAAWPAQACSLTGTRRVPFSESDCMAQLRQWVDFLNRAPGMTVEQIGAEMDDAGDVTIERDWVHEEIGGRNVGGRSTETFYQIFRMSDGRLDTRPIRLADTNKIRQLRNRASYQFTLERYRYHAADPEGCNGLFTHGEFSAVEQSSYLATFYNNRLDAVRRFPEWYLEDRRS